MNNKDQDVEIATARIYALYKHQIERGRGQTDLTLEQARAQLEATMNAFNKKRQREAKARIKHTARHNVLENIPRDLSSQSNASFSGVERGAKVPSSPSNTEIDFAPESTEKGQTDQTEINSATIRGSFDEFSNDMLALLSDASFSDVIIKSGTKCLKVHKNILSARSPVFRAMFNNPMRESSEGTVSIDDLDPDTVQDLMSFIYSNQVHNQSVPKACDLLNAAEKYQLQSLKCKCVDYLTSSLSVDNAIQILQKSDLHDEKLKMHSINFISENFSHLKETEEWKNVQLHNPTLAFEVFNLVVENLTRNR